MNSSELKQSISHQILGTTFKDIDKAMRAVINERQLTPSQEEELELREVAPEKFEAEFDPKIGFLVNKHAADPKKSFGYGTYTREQVAELLAANSFAPKASEPVAPTRSSYPTFTREQVEVLMREHFEYANRKKEQPAWDSQKTTESEPKINPAKKRLTSTKG